MAYSYILLTLTALVSMMECLQMRPNCSQLGQYALPDGLRLQLFAGVDAHAPKREVSMSLAYKCALEGMAGIILENPQKPLTCPESLGVFPLIFEIEEEPGVDVSVMTQAAFKTWEKHIPTLRFASTFGCNYIKEHGLHRYMCLFK
ncbi:hypothetical protein ANCCAN_04226 [Ancylostoma caninum]|uniref:SCP domain-containing protein n=1 Tax=Ancylostoma caninum TaxID=29170 RepID=A0A368H2D0_ANCCA|nr:hypothetical protein ANCCAN_04226 [Ancylostoma caninum]